MLKILKRIFDHEYKELEKFKLIADKVFELEDKYSKLTDKQLKDSTKKLKKRLSNGESLDDIIHDAFATVRDAAFRTSIRCSCNSFW